MIRTVTIVTAVFLATGAARAQSLEGGIWSGFSSNISSGFSGNVNTGFQSGFGARGGSRARIDDSTLGSTGGFTPGMLKGQPSNFGPSVQSMGPLSRSTLTFDNGPPVALDPGAGPAGPMD